MIDFNVPPYTGKEFDYMKKTVENHKICGDGEFSEKCSRLMESETGCPKILLTTSGSSALDMAAMLCELKEGDEVIMSSFTFSSTANAFVLSGATVVFVDIRPDTMNIDEKLIESAITDKTKVIVPMHYAGIGCEMDSIMKTAAAHNIDVVEDAAQGVMTKYKGRALGTFGRFGCFSFHETKNYSMGEGGAILVNNEKDRDRAEIIREKGTDRSRFLRGQIDKYTWVDKGSSYLPSDMNAAYLYAQLEMKDTITRSRLDTWQRYYEALAPLAADGLIERPYIPEYCEQNGHMFYIKVKNIEERTRLGAFLKENGIRTAFHYIPLHSAPAGRRFGRFHGEDKYTTAESERLLRLPMYYGLKPEETDYICEKITDFYTRR